MSVTGMGGKRPLVVFDGDCAFCTSSINWLTHVFAASFDVVPYQRADLVALGLTPAQCHARLQWLTDPGRGSVPGNQRSGARAVAAILCVGGRGRSGAVGAGARVLAALAAYPPGSWVAAGAYAVVAANRTRLPGGTPACAL